MGSIFYNMATPNNFYHNKANFQVFFFFFKNTEEDSHIRYLADDPYFGRWHGKVAVAYKIMKFIFGQGKKRIR